MDRKNTLSSMCEDQDASLGPQSKQARLTHLAWHLGISPSASMYTWASVCVAPWGGGHSKLPSVASVCNLKCPDLLFFSCQL